MGVDLDMNLYVAVEDFDECLEEVGTAFEGKHDVQLVTPSGARVKCPISDQLDDEEEIKAEYAVTENIHVDISGGEYFLHADFGDRFARISLGWCAPFDFTSEMYEDLLEYVDPSVDCLRTVGQAGEMCPLIGEGRQLRADDSLRPAGTRFDSIDAEAASWFSAARGD